MKPFATLKKPIWAATAALVMLILITACNPATDSQATPLPSLTSSPSATPAATALPTAFDGQVWQWLAFQDSASGDERNDLTLDDPSKYTLALQPGGTFTFRADCNTGSGRYTMNESSLKLFPEGMTLAACGPDSLYERYVALLGNVVSFVIDAEGNLIFNLVMDSGNMIFVPAPPAEEPTPQPTAAPSAGSTLLDSSSSWHGIGRINLSGNCTAVLIDTGAGDSASAYVLTNGHCVEWQANGTITDQEVEGQVLFNYFADAPDAALAIPLAEVVYSTMQGVDLSIVRLDTTLGGLAAQGILPFPIADTPLETDSAVRVVGAPSSGLEAEQAYLREEVCQIKQQVDLLEFNWHFYDHYATSCQDIFGGSSGSPLFSAETNTIYGLINTTVEGSSACYLGVPCEIGDQGVILNEDSSYASPIHGLNACFDAAGEFALSADCPLPPTTQLSIAETARSPSQPPLTWGTTLAGNLPYYRYKTGAASAVDCRLDDGYSPVFALAENPTIDDAIPTEEGFYLLCVLAGASPRVDDTWQNPDYPTVISAQIDTTPPQLEPQLSIRELPEFYDVGLIFLPPELSDYRYKFGPPETTDCTVESDYERYRRIPLTLERGDGAIRLCVIGYDNADNPTPPLDTVFDE